MKENIIVIVETKSFSKKFDKLATEIERIALYKQLEIAPKDGDVIIGSGGIRKLRWSRPGMGKRSGMRIIYYFFDNRGLISLLTVYAKNEQENLDKHEIQSLREIVEYMTKKMDDDNE